MKRESHGTSYTHNELWSCCEHMFSSAQSNPQGCFYFYLSGMLFAYLSYEAYINFLVEILLPGKEGKEQSLRLSVKKKLELIEEVCDFKIDKENDPYSHVAQLGKFRGFLCHGKTKEYSVTNEAIRTSPDFPMGGPLHSAVTSEKAVLAKEQVQRLVSEIHEAINRNSNAPKKLKRYPKPFDDLVDEVSWTPLKMRTYGNSVGE